MFIDQVVDNNVKIDHCFYKENIELCWDESGRHMSINEIEFEPTEKEYYMLLEDFGHIYDPRIGFRSSKENHNKNYLFVLKEKNVFYLLYNSFPRTISNYDINVIDNYCEKPSCEITFSKIAVGELDTKQYPFLKPHLRKDKIKNLIRQKNNMKR